jgi:hypothetical protein
LRENVEKRIREELDKGAQVGVGPIMKRNLAPGSGVGEDDVLEWSTREDWPMKRLGVEDIGSGSSGMEGLGDEECALWWLWYVITLREKRAHMCGA